MSEARPGRTAGSIGERGHKGTRTRTRTRNTSRGYVPGRIRRWHDGPDTFGAAAWQAPRCVPRPRPRPRPLCPRPRLALTLKQRLNQAEDLTCAEEPLMAGAPDCQVACTSEVRARTGENAAVQRCPYADELDIPRWGVGK